MRCSTRFRIVSTVIILLLLLLPIAAQNDRLPASLSDREFWSLTGQISEPDGFFRSNSGSPDNLLSNESQLSTVAARLATLVKPSGVYLGVGPEQNFTYIAAVRPRIAFITDIRRGNLHLHLVYKALFEMASNRNEFVSLLFTRKRTAGLPPGSGARALMNAYQAAERGDEAAFRANLKAITDHLTRTRSLPLDADDIAGIEYVYRTFYRFGPDIHYTSSVGGTSGTRYADIVSALDTATRTERSYFANEENFAYVKGMEQKNLIIPIVGDFAGPKALRGIGTYLRERGAVVSAFYVSNVEMYLRNNGVWEKFCANVATMPLDASSTFIRPGGGGIVSGDLSPIAADIARCPR
jgi:hypothetical protein